MLFVSFPLLDDGDLGSIVLVGNGKAFCGTAVDLGSITAYSFLLYRVLDLLAILCVLRQFLHGSLPVIGLQELHGLYIFSGGHILQGYLDRFRPLACSVVVIHPHFLNRNVDGLLIILVGIGDGEAAGRISGDLDLVILQRTGGGNFFYSVLNLLAFVVLKKQVFHFLCPIIGFGQLEFLYHLTVSHQFYLDGIRTLILLALIIPGLGDGDVDLIFVFFFTCVLIGDVVAAVGDFVALRHRILSHAVSNGVAVFILGRTIGKGIGPIGVLGCGGSDLVALLVLGRLSVLIETNGDGLGTLLSCVVIVIPGLFAPDGLGVRIRISLGDIELDIDDVGHQMSHIRDGIKTQILKILHGQRLRLG